MNEKGKALILHAGFPKTGTSSLQKWLSANLDLLHSCGIDYPYEFRDAEGWGHHDLKRVLSEGPRELAFVFLKIVRDSAYQNILISAECLCECLADEGFGSADYFPEIIMILSQYSVNVRIVFCLRELSGYIPSIVVQNVVASGLSARPSAYGAGVIDGLARAYAAIHRLLMMESVALFVHSPTINQSILGYFFSCVDAVFDPQAHSLPIVNARLPAEVILFFMWLNLNSFRPSHDFSAFIKSDSRCLVALKEMYNKALELSDFSNTLNEPVPSELIHSSLVYLQTLWPLYFSKDSEGFAQHGKQYGSLAYHYMRRSAEQLISFHCKDLDLLFEIAKDRINSPHFFACKSLLQEFAMLASVSLVAEDLWL
jgi:hypothetical protein